MTTPARKPLVTYRLRNRTNSRIIHSYFQWRAEPITTARTRKVIWPPTSWPEFHFQRTYAKLRYINTPLYIYLTTRRDVNYIVGKTSNTIIWRYLVRGRSPLPDVRRTQYWHIHDGLKAMRRLTKANGLYITCCQRAHAANSQLSLLLSIIPRVPFKNTRLQLTIVQPRAHGFKRLKKWPRRKKRLQRLRARFEKYAL